ncbi:hypothetical protein ACDP95_06990 [Weissella confusa]
MDINLDDLKDKAADALEGADLNELKDKAGELLGDKADMLDNVDLDDVTSYQDCLEKIK